ncbi:M24 family metallopeptidase [Nonomuraea sp. FMUSA5-5]|uniref:M24 family metallopeptidase n=1 Tax=Nonomuraea composti TaxID=2720023 RepID=A0ABX1BSM9_9ACTN|nr:M24 family metallopeptidase [Nonomuraea sp. FMUSA5-5]NJP97738.1 M24 family metallopeptidase [Nonomuraea sp. FMUSA5-5]
MLKEPPRYSIAERDRRWNLARDLMDDEGVQALVVYGEHEMVYPAPYAPDTYFTNDRPGAIVVFPRDADPIVLVGTPMTIGDHIEAQRRGEATWITPGNMRVARHPEGVVQVLREHGLEQAAIGVLGIDPCPPWHFVPIMPHAYWAAMTEHLPHATFKGVYRPFYARTSAQSAEELAVLAYAAEAGEAVAHAMLTVARPGATDAEVCAAGTAEALRRGVMIAPMIINSGPGTISWGMPGWSYRPQAPRVLAEGDIVLAEVMCFYGMKETQHQVAIAIGEVHRDAVRAATVARASYEAGLQALRPGRRFGEVVEAMRAPLDEAGGWNVHPLIHALNPFGPVCGWGAGMRARPEAVSYGLITEVPTIGAEVPLAPGMSFSLEPNCVVGDHTVNLGGTVVVGDHEPVEHNPFTARLLQTEG